MFTIDSMASRPNSVIIELLKAMVPYSEQNLKLAFKPKLFFNDLERATFANRDTIKTTFNRALRIGYIISQDGNPILSELGRAKIPDCFRPPLLRDWLIIAFDIPESRRYVRTALRVELKRRGFQQLQKSVWFSKYDYANEMDKIVVALKISCHVKLLYATLLTAPTHKM